MGRKEHRAEDEHVDGLSSDIILKLRDWADRAKRTVANKKYTHNKRLHLLMPDSTNRAIWDMINMTLMTWTIFEIPFSMLFADAQEKECPWDVLMIINIFVDLLFLTDIVVSMNTAYYDREGILIEDRQQIIRHYLSGWFFVDITTSLPIDGLMCLIDPNAVSGQLFRIIKIVRFLKMARMLKVQISLNVFVLQTFDF